MDTTAALKKNPGLTIKRGSHTKEELEALAPPHGRSRAAPPPRAYRRAACAQHFHGAVHFVPAAVRGQRFADAGQRAVHDGDEPVAQTPRRIQLSARLDPGTAGAVHPELVPCVRLHHAGPDHHLLAGGVRVLLPGIQRQKPAVHAGDGNDDGPRRSNHHLQLSDREPDGHSGQLPCADPALADLRHGHLPVPAVLHDLPQIAV